MNPAANRDELQYPETILRVAGHLSGGSRTGPRQASPGELPRRGDAVPILQALTHVRIEAPSR